MEIQWRECAKYPRIVRRDYIASYTLENSGMGIVNMGS